MRNEKILLINPPVSIYINKTAFIPLPLLVLGSCLKIIQENGFDFSYELLDLDLMLKQGFFPMIAVLPASSDLIFDKKPDILLFTVHGLNHIVVLKLAERIKMSAVKRCCRWWCWSNPPSYEAFERREY